MKDPKDNKTVDAFEKKPMTAAERKAKQRATMKDKARLDCYISIEAKQKLNEYRPAHMTIGETIETLILITEMENSIQSKQVYKAMDYALEQYRLYKTDLYLGRAQGVAQLAFKLSIINDDQLATYYESLIWARNNG